MNKDLTQNLHFKNLIELKQRKTAIEQSKLEYKQKLQQIQAEISTGFDLISGILDDYDSVFLIRNNTFIREFIFQSISDLIKSSKNEDKTKHGFEVLEMLLLKNYDTENEEFSDSQAVSFYGSILLSILPKMSDIAIEESFYSEADSISEFQDTLLSLIYFTLKSIKLRTLFYFGFRPKHLQFIIINFPQSQHLPKLNLAIAQNLRNLEQPKLYEHEAEFSEEMEYDFHQCVKKIYSLCVKTFDLFFKILKDASSYMSNNSKTISMTYSNLAQYAKENFSPEKCKNENNIFYKNTRRIMKSFRKRLYEESVKKGKNYYQICFIIEIIEYNFDNLNYESQKDMAFQIIFSLRNILTSIFQSGKLRKFKSYELNARAKCFSLILKLVENLKNDFIKDHLRSIEFVWLNGLKSNSKMAIKAFVSLLRLKNNDLKAFIQKVILNINRSLSNDIETINSYSKTIIAIVEYNAASRQTNLEADFMPLIETIRQNYKNLLSTNVNCIYSYADFIFKVLQAGFRSKTNLTNEWQSHLISSFVLFQDIIDNNIRISICIKTYLICLDMIEFFTRHSRLNEFLYKYGQTIFEMLVRIETKLKENDWDRYELYETELNEMFDYTQKFIS